MNERKEIAEAITVEGALRKIKENEGKIFRVNFTKRSNGEEREMVARTGVYSHLQGGEKKYDPEEYDLLGVFDMQKEGYRSINLRTLHSLKINGEEFDVVQES